MVALRIKDASGDKVNYVHKDHLGSIQCLTDDAGALVQELSYDAWGNRRDATTWQVYITPLTGLITDRGFTGHEHIDLFDLVNMDGRVYDPVVGRFLSADPMIQDPENLQSLNRYSYCVNNPLSLTDPSGYSWLSKNWKSLVTAAVAITVAAVTAGLGSGLGIAVLSGASGGFAGGVSGVLLNGGDLGQALKAGIVGGLLGAATGFLNYASGFGSTLEKMFKHAFTDGFMGMAGSAANGGDIQSPVKAMIGGALSSLGNGFINEDFNGQALKLASSAVLGGTISEIGGGKFANGAISSAYSMLFNDMMHAVYFKNKQRAYDYMVRQARSTGRYHEVAAWELKNGILVLPEIGNDLTNSNVTYFNPSIDSDGNRIITVNGKTQVVINSIHTHDGSYDPNSCDPIYFSHGENGRVAADESMVKFMNKPIQILMDGHMFSAQSALNYKKIW